MDERIGTFIDEADAYTQCEAAGYVAMKFDFPAEENEFHWHDFDSLTFITGGELTVFDVDSGESRTCSSGTKLVGRKGVVHREKSEGYSAIIGFSVPVAELTQPVNKALPVSV